MGSNSNSSAAPKDLLKQAAHNFEQWKYGQTRLESWAAKLPTMPPGSIVFFPTCQVRVVRFYFAATPSHPHHPPPPPPPRPPPRPPRTCIHVCV